MAAGSVLLDRLLIVTAFYVVLLLGMGTIAEWLWGAMLAGERGGVFFIDVGDGRRVGDLRLWQREHDAALATSHPAPHESLVKLNVLAALADDRQHRRVPCKRVEERQLYAP
jgi:hypothetical protein